MFGLSSCGWCKLALGIALVAILLVLAQLGVAAAAGSAIVAALAEAGVTVSAAVVTNVIQIIAIVLAVGITISEIGDYIACKFFGCSACCEQGSSEFWITFGARIEENPSGLRPEDCRDLERLIRRLEVNRQIDDVTARRLREALARHCG